MQQKCEARQAELLEVKSALRHLAAAAAQQSQDVRQLCEQLGRLDVPGALAELKSFISGPRGPTHVRDSTAQTSPPRASAEPAAGEVRGEGAKRAALPGEAGGDGKRSRDARDKATQTNPKCPLSPKTSSRGRPAAGASRLLSLHVKDAGTSPRRPATAVCSGGPGEPRPGGQPPPRSTRRGRPPGRRKAQPQSKAGAFRPPRPPPPGAQCPPPEPQEARAQRPHRRALRPLSGHSSQDGSRRSDSARGDPRMRWFSDLTPESCQAPQAQPGRPVLYRLGLDSSDDSC